MVFVYNMVLIPNLHLPINLLPYQSNILPSFRNIITFDHDPDNFLRVNDMFFINFSEIANIYDLPLYFPKSGVLSVRFSSLSDIKIEFNKEKSLLFSRTGILSSSSFIRSKYKTRNTFYPYCSDDISKGYYSTIQNQISSKDILLFNKCSSFSIDKFCIGGHPSCESLIESNIDPEEQFSTNPYVNVLRVPLFINDKKISLNIITKENDLSNSDFSNIIYHFEI